MNYIYDIVLNFQDNYYNFYEWKKRDRIKNIYKIPIYRVSDKDLIILKNNKVRIDNNFLSKIKKTNKKNMCLISNTKLTIGLLFNSRGYLLKRSSLIIEEENEANKLSKKQKITKINYLENIEKTPSNKSRIEIEKKEVLLNYINKTTNYIILKYLYYEYFQKECNNLNNIKQSLIKEIEKDWNQKHNKLYHIIKILIKKNIPTK